ESERESTEGWMFLNEGNSLVIDWTQMPTYNTIMAVAAGAALMSLVHFARELRKEKDVHLESWALALGVPGFILTITGVHMSLTWPLAKYFPYDNVIFGETSFGFGVLLLAAAFYLWKRAGVIVASGDAPRYLARVSRPLSLFIVGMGLALGAIAMAGLVYQLFAAPPEEPISGAFAGYPWLEATFMSGMFGVIGIGAVLFPLAMREFAAGSSVTVPQRIVGWVWWLGGLGFFLFGALNFFTHIGLIVHTMG
ncbi:MAG TPA: DUF981 family protein, partial [Candidatus Elarobacter sp.]|nr:DUF981 family protein [Candidatus Elarobacter sp.]